MTARTPTTVHIARQLVDGEHDMSTDDAWWWVPVLGPSSTLALHMLNQWGAATPTMSFETSDLSMALGHSVNQYRLMKSLERLVAFDAAESPAFGVFVIPSHLRLMTPGQQNRMPAFMRSAYQQMFMSDATRS